MRGAREENVSRGNKSKINLRKRLSKRSMKRLSAERM